MGTPSRGTHFCTNLSFFPPLDVQEYAFGWKKMPFCTILTNFLLLNRSLVSLEGNSKCNLLVNKFFKQFRWGIGGGNGLFFHLAVNARGGIAPTGKHKVYPCGHCHFFPHR